MSDAPGPKEHSSPRDATAGVGSAFRRSVLTASLAGAVATLVVGCDLALVALDERTDLRRAILCAAAIGVLCGLAKWDWPSLGLGLRVQPSLRYWLKAAAVIGVFVALFCVAVFAAVWVLCPELLDWRPWAAPSDFWRWTPHACLITPLLEETIYRFALCSVGAALLGRWPTVVLSGLVFAGLHVLYGNPSPENLIAGLFLGWAYLRSENLLVPIALHSLGNLAVALWNLGVVVLAG